MTVVVPHTGEVLPDLGELSTVQIAELFDGARDMERQLAEFRQRLGDELVDRLDRRCEWTLRAGPWEITAPSNAPVLAVDVEPFRAAVAALVAEEIIEPFAAAAAINRKTTYTPVIRGVRALLKNQEIAARLADICRDVPPAPGARRVTIKRAS